MPERETTPTWPGVWIYPGMMPILHSSGVMIARAVRTDQSVVFLPSIYRFTLTISSTGMPSVMQITRSSSASTASMIESAAKAGGT